MPAETLATTAPSTAVADSGNAQELVHGHAAVAVATDGSTAVAANANVNVTLTSEQIMELAKAIKPVATSQSTGFSMVETPTTPLPQEYALAADYLQTVFLTRPLAIDGKNQLLTDATVQLSKGFDVETWKPDASKDVLQVRVTSPTLVDSKIADATSQMVLRSLNDIAAVRNEVILVSPSEYLENVHKQLATLMAKAKEAQIPGSDFDYSKSSIFDPNFSSNQIPTYGIQLVEGPHKTQIRINIPTNPTDREKAMQTAKRVADHLTQRLPQIKEAMIKRIVDKNYIPNLDDAGKKHLQDHVFEVNTQQQDNWTSVFIDISSPEQKAAEKNPGQKIEPEALQKSNMLVQIVDEQKRFKLASRTVLFEGDKLKTPSSIFNDVAGSLDVETAVGKVLHHLGKAKPELASEIDALLKENVFKRRDQWNLPPEQQDEFKRRVSGRIAPDKPDVMTFTFSVPKGKALDIIKSIATINQPVQTAAAPAPAATEPLAMDPSTVTTQLVALGNASGVAQLTPNGAVAPDANAATTNAAIMQLINASNTPSAAPNAPAQPLLPPLPADALAKLLQQNAPKSPVEQAAMAGAPLGRC